MNNNNNEIVFVDPMSDIGFKKIFANEYVLITFLNLLLASQKKTIRKITYLNKESITQSEDKMMIFDLYCEADDGTNFIIEMQRRSEPNYIERTLFYMGQAVSEQPKPGFKWKYDLAPVIGVFFLNFHLSRYKKPEHTVRCFTLKDQNNKKLTDLFQMFFVDLRSFTKSESACVDSMDRWLYVIKNAKNLKKMPFVTQEEVFATIADVASYSKLTKEERWAYDESLKHARDWEWIVDGERQDAREEGIGIGEARGEVKTKNATAKKMKNKGYSLDDISEITGLTEEEIMAL